MLDDTKKLSINELTSAVQIHAKMYNLIFDVLLKNKNDNAQCVYDTLEQTWKSNITFISKMLDDMSAHDCITMLFKKAFESCDDIPTKVAYMSMISYIEDKKINLNELIVNRDIYKIKWLLENNKIKKEQITEEVFINITKLAVRTNQYDIIKVLFNLTEY